MKLRFFAFSCSILAILLLFSSSARAQSALLYPGAEKYGDFFGPAEPFSDHDEAKESKTTIKLVKVVTDLPKGEKGSVLRADFNVADNSVLGYQYAGLALGFVTPQSIDLTGTIRVQVRASVDTSVVPDVTDSVKGRRVLPPVALSAGKWTEITIPASETDHLIHKEIDHVSLSLLQAGIGSLDIYSLEVPLAGGAPPPPAPPIVAKETAVFTAVATPARKQ